MTSKRYVILIIITVISAGCETVQPSISDVNVKDIWDIIKPN